MKRFVLLASVAFVAMGAAACTREKPPVTVPTSAPGAAAQGTSPSGTGVAQSTQEATLPEATLPSDQSTQPFEALTPLATWTPSEAGPTAAAPSAPSAGTGTTGPTTYTVQWGDWLSKIASRFGVSTQAIVAANPGLDPNRIVPGQVLNIPAAGVAVATSTPGASAAPASGSPGTYTVQRGDWFYAIARKFGVSVAALQAANPGVQSNVVYPGQVLNIPGGGANPPASTQPSGKQTTYVVKAGDTLFSIAVRFHTTSYALQIANHLANANFIYVGQSLVIP